MKKQILHVSELWLSAYEDVSYPLNFEQLSFNVLNRDCGVGHGDDIFCWKTNKSNTHLFASDNQKSFDKYTFFGFKDFLFDYLVNQRNEISSRAEVLHMMSSRLWSYSMQLVSLG